MRSPQDMQIILIDITNACNQKCSNCTRFCGNHPKPFFMDFETFQRAVDSMEGFEGITGIIGGEPTLHPEFARFARYIRERLGNREKPDHMVNPQREFIKGIRQQEFQSRVMRERLDGTHDYKMHGPCLFSNLGPGYLKNYELIQDSFDVQFLNDHIKASMHQPGLVSRKDLGISDEEWPAIRDACWLQDAWSATITPKGAFFCEIAAALDMLFHGPGGWPIEPGWWKRKPEDFGDQLHWCELCGFALKTFMRSSKDEIDDVSPTLYKMLEEVGSPRLKAGRTKLLQVGENGTVSMDGAARENRFSDTQPYVEYYEDRFGAKNDELKIEGYKTIQIQEGKEFGVKLNEELLSNDAGWTLLCLNGMTKPTGVDKLIKSYVFNPGSVHIGDGFALFHRNAASLRRLGFDRIARMRTFREILEKWEPKKIIPVEEIPKRSQRRSSAIREGERVAIWGTGLAGGYFLDLIRLSGGTVPFAVNSSPENWGREFYDLTIVSPETLKERENDYDTLLVAHYSRFEEIKAQALALGIDENRILLPYEAK